MINIVKRGALSFALLSTFTTVNADVYKWVNEDGVVEYSDQPKVGAEKIKVKTPQTVTLPKGKDVFGTPAATSDTKSTANTYQSIVITQPANDSAFNSGSGSVSISSEPTPALMNDHTIQLVVDGKAYSSNKSGSFNLTNVDRGTHQVQVNIINANGDVIKSSDITTFTIHRPIARNPIPAG